MDNFEKILLNGDPNADLRDHRSALRSLDGWRRQDRGQILNFSLSTENEPRLIWNAVALTAENPPSKILVTYGIIRPHS